jgi:hypothetical protein
MNSDDTHISSYAQIVHTLFAEGTLDKDEVYRWMDDFELSVLECNKNKISFLFTEGYIQSKMTIFSSGKIFVDSGYDDIQ